MKNIHVIPTDKQSKLFSNNNKLYFQPSHGYPIGYNIYITSDEEIKEGDWVLYTKGIKIHCQKLDNKEDVELANIENSGVLKIILTTDQDLIKNGVQGIDDEFLEWFVKNPGCEEIEVEREKSIGYAGDRQRTFYGGYKIIIPKEELPKSELKIGDNTNFGIITDINEKSVCFGKNKVGVDVWYKKSDVKKEPKKETLEEAAEKYSKRSSASVFQENHKKDFIQGANWQAERMYNEEDLRTAYNISKNANNFDEWFEQFKKK